MRLEANALHAASGILEFTIVVGASVFCAIQFLRESLKYRREHFLRELIGNPLGKQLICRADCYHSVGIFLVKILQKIIANGVMSEDPDKSSGNIREELIA